MGVGNVNAGGKAGATTATSEAAEAVGGARGAACTAVAAAAVPIPKILDDVFGILATRETGGVGTGIESAGVAEGIAAAVAAGITPAAGGATGCETEGRKKAAAAEENDAVDTPPKTGKLGMATEA